MRQLLLQLHFPLHQGLYECGKAVGKGVFPYQQGMYMLCAMDKESGMETPSRDVRLSTYTRIGAPPPLWQPDFFPRGPLRFFGSQRSAGLGRTGRDPYLGCPNYWYGIPGTGSYSGDSEWQCWEPRCLVDIVCHWRHDARRRDAAYLGYPPGLTSTRPLGGTRYMTPVQGIEVR